MATAVTVSFPTSTAEVFNSVATIAALRALPSSSQFDGANVLLEGSAAAGDGGGGIYVYDVGSLVADNGSSVLKPDDLTALQMGRWLAVGADPVLRTDLAATTGSLLIKHKMADTGTYGRTLRQWAVVGGMDNGNVFNHIDDTLDSAILARTNTTDLSTMIQNAATASKGKLRFPSGSYIFSNVTVEDAVVEGVGIGEQDAPVAEGTIFLHKSTTNPLFNIKRGSAFRGFTVYNPDQVTTGVPTVYPPAFLGDPASTETNISFEDIVAINPYIFVRFGDAAKTVSHGRLSLRYCTIYGVYRSIEAFSLLDVLQVSDCMFTHGPFDAITNGAQTLKNWTATNGQCVVADRLDGLQFNNNIIFGPNQGLRVVNALSNLWTITGNIFDACPYPLILEGASDLANTSIVGNNFHAYQVGNAAAEGNAILINGNGASGTELAIVGNHFAESRGSHIVVTNTTLKSIILSANNMGPLATATGVVTPRYAVSITDANANVVIADNIIEPVHANSVGVGIMNAKTVSLTGNTIDGANVPIALSAVAISAVIAGNTTANTSGVESASIAAAARAQITWGPNKLDKPQHLTIGSPKFLASLAASTTANAATETTMLFGTEVINTTGAYNPTTSIFTAPQTGTYRLSYRLTHDSTIVTTDVWAIQVKTTARDYTKLYRAPFADNLSVDGCVLANMTAGDTAKVTVARLSGTGSFVTVVDGNLSEFSGELVL